MLESYAFNRNVCNATACQLQFGAIGDWMMKNPGWWNHEMTIVPSRIRANRLLQRVKHRQDSEGMIWPDYQRPHIYFW